MIDTRSFRSNTNVIASPTYRCLPLNPIYNYYQDYLERILEVIDDALYLYPSILIVRFDLRIPHTNSQNESILDYRNLISKFLASFDAKLKARMNQRGKQGYEVYPTQSFHIWVSEQKASEQPHYHFFLLLHGKLFRNLGPFTDKARILNERTQNKYLAQLIIEAWSSALMEAPDKCWNLIHFVPKVRRLNNVNDNKFKDIFRWLAYMAKVETKHFGIGRRSFGASKRLKRESIHETA